MVESQLRTNKVTDNRVLEAFEAVPRERFVPEAKSNLAYIDEDLAIGGGRYLMEPMVLARLLQAAEIGPGDVALDIGCGTGFASAVLARLAGTVVSLESESNLAARATALLEELGADNAVVVEGALAEGYAKQAPYDVILLGGSVGEVPAPIFDQLSDRGRLIAVLRDERGIGEASLFRRSGGSVSRRALFDAATPFLPGFEKESGFVF